MNTSEIEFECLITENRVSQLLSVSVSWLRKDRAQYPNNIVPFLKLGNSVRYQMTAISAAVEKLARAPAPPAPPAPARVAPPRRGRGRPRKAEARHA